MRIFLLHLPRFVTPPGTKKNASVALIFPARSSRFLLLLFSRPPFGKMCTSTNWRIRITKASCVGGRDRGGFLRILWQGQGNKNQRKGGKLAHDASKSFSKIEISISSQLI